MFAKQQAPGPAAIDCFLALAASATRRYRPTQIVIQFPPLVAGVLRHQILAAERQFAASSEVPGQIFGGTQA
jgi:hypothetical protein